LTLNGITHFRIEGAVVGIFFHFTPSPVIGSGGVVDATTWGAKVKSPKRGQAGKTTQPGSPKRGQAGKTTQPGTQNYR